MSDKQKAFDRFAKRHLSKFTRPDERFAYARFGFSKGWSSHARAMRKMARRRKR